MRRRHLLAALPVLAAAPPAAAEGLDDLLRVLGPAAPAPAGSVEVHGWVERGAEGPVLVVMLEPRGAAKLVADPGITIEPVAAAGLRWADAQGVSLVDADRDYFGAPPVLRLPFTGDAAAVTARIDYAWCLADYQCLFGEAVVTVPVSGS